VTTFYAQISWRESSKLSMLDALQKRIHGLFYLIKPMLRRSLRRKCLGVMLHAISISGAMAQDLPKLIAHRGASHEAPENTMAAFRLAWEQGADGIEADFLLSKDGQVVCIHDKDTKKTGSKNLVVSKSTLKELRAIEYGSWKHSKFKGEPIPILSDVLDVLPQDKWFFLEIKDTEKIVAPIAEILRAKQANKDRVVIISFNGEVIKKCRDILPEYRTCLLHSLKDFQDKGQADKYLTQLKASQSQGLAYKEDPAIPADWLTKAVGDDGILATWTVNSPEPAMRSIGRGVDFIITDRPAALHAELKAVLKK
jgi:glycerophosphoryl diester phosphodiesterase